MDDPITEIAELWLLERFIEWLPQLLAGESINPQRLETILQERQREAGEPVPAHNSFIVTLFQGFAAGYLAYGKDSKITDENDNGTAYLHSSGTAGIPESNRKNAL